MPKKNKKYYRKVSRPVNTANPPVNSSVVKTAPAPVRASAPASKSTVMVTSQTVGAELKVIAILTITILAAIIILSIVLH